MDFAKLRNMKCFGVDTHRTKNNLSKERSDISNKFGKLPKKRKL